MKLVIWDFRNTLFNTDTGEFNSGALVALKFFQKDYIQFLVTSSTDPEKRISEIRGLGIDKFFKEIIISAKSKELFEKIINNNDASPEETIVIGDQYASEIAIGNEIGAKTIWLAYGNPDEKKFGIKYWKKIRSLEEIPNMEL